MGNEGYEIEQQITVSCPPSVVLGGIERYFNKRGRVLQPIVPLKDVGTPGRLALERRVVVEAAARSSAANRMEDRTGAYLVNDGSVNLRRIEMEVLGIW